MDGGIIFHNGYGWWSHKWTAVKGAEALRAVCMFFGIRQPRTIRGEPSRRPLSVLLEDNDEGHIFASAKMRRPALLWRQRMRLRLSQQATSQRRLTMSASPLKADSKGDMAGCQLGATRGKGMPPVTGLFAECVIHHIGGACVCFWTAGSI